MKFGADIPFVNHLGFALEHCEGGESRIAFDPKPEHLNSFGVLHGGACMTLLDVALAVAARSLDMRLGVVTIEMKTSFMQSARGPVVAKGRILRRTRKMAFCEGSLYDAAGELCAHATGTFKFVAAAENAPLITD